MLRQGRGSSLGRNLRTSIEVIDGDDLSLPFFGMSSCMHLISGHTVLSLAVRILIQAKSKEWRNKFLHTFDIASFYAGSMSVHEFSVRLSSLQDFHTIAIHLGYEKFMSIIHVGVKILIAVNTICLSIHTGLPAGFWAGWLAGVSFHPMCTCTQSK
jgi:hypothetical protein